MSRKPVSLLQPRSFAKRRVPRLKPYAKCATCGWRMVALEVDGSPEPYCTNTACKRVEDDVIAEEALRLMRLSGMNVYPQEIINAVLERVRRERS